MGKLANVNYMTAVLMNNFCHIHQFQLQEYINLYFKLDNLKPA